MFWWRRDIVNIDKGYFVEGIRKNIELAEDKESVELLSMIIRQMFFDIGDVTRENLLEPYFDKDHYFPKFLCLSGHESFVDGGAFVGDTFEEFIKRVGGKFDDYFAFEMNHDNAMTFENKIVGNDFYHEHVKIMPKGLYDRTGKIRVQLNAQSSQVIKDGRDDGSEYLDVVALDDILADNRVTYIKMDVEDSEVPALYGAKRIISEQRPTCAISMYHSMKQFVEVPEILKKYNDRYRFRYRMHSTIGHDLVCYAIDDGKE